MKNLIFYFLFLLTALNCFAQTSNNVRGAKVILHFNESGNQPKNEKIGFSSSTWTNASFSKGKFGNGIDFSGGSYATVFGVPNEFIGIDLSHVWSATFWVKLPTTPISGINYLFTTQSTDSGDRPVLVYFRGDESCNGASVVLSIHQESSGDFDSIIQSQYDIAQLFDGEWHNYAITCAGNGTEQGIKIYINGKDYGTCIENNTGNGTGTRNQLFIGAPNPALSTSNYLTGSMDDFILTVGTELSSSEINKIFNSQIKGKTKLLQ